MKKGPSALAGRSRAEAGFYFQLAAGLTSQLEVTLGLRTPEEARELQCRAVQGSAGTASSCQAALGRDLFHAAEAGNAKQAGAARVLSCGLLR